MSSLLSLFSVKIKNKLNFFMYHTSYSYKDKNNEKFLHLSLKDLATGINM